MVLFSKIQGVGDFTQLAVNKHDGVFGHSVFLIKISFQVNFSEFI